LWNNMYGYMEWNEGDLLLLCHCNTSNQPSRIILTYCSITSGFYSLLIRKVTLLIRSITLSAYSCLKNVLRRSEGSLICCSISIIRKLTLLCYVSCSLCKIVKWHASSAREFGILFYLRFFFLNQNLLSIS